MIAAEESEQSFELAERAYSDLLQAYPLRRAVESGFVSVEQLKSKSKSGEALWALKNRDDFQQHVAEP